MEVLSIGITAPTTSLRQRLTRGLKFLLDEGITVELKETGGKAYHTMTLSLAVASRSRLTVSELSSLGRQYAAHVLADYLIEEREHALLKQLVDRDFSCFSPEEQERIMALAHKFLNVPGFYQSSRHSNLRERLLEFMVNHRHINPDGFLRFRLPHYVSDLRDVMARAVEEYLSEKEYQEFVRLLRYFVEIQEPKLPVVHVVTDADGFCQIYDMNYVQLHHEYLNSYDEEDALEASYEDLVISALITIAPHNIFLHRNAQNRAEMYDTIRHIFESRVTDCASCELCHSATASPNR